jgi:hypothetical protein
VNGTGDADARILTITASQTASKTTATAMIIFLIRSADTGDPRPKVTCGQQGRC